MQEFDRLIEIMRRLRAPGGCPWDAEQNHQSIAHCAIEEAHELVEAIETHDAPHMREELGDVLLQVIFHSIIGEDEGEFTLPEVIEGLSAKLIHRHPHVFGDASVNDAAEVSRNWEKLKQQEHGKHKRTSIFDGIPTSLPAMQAARKIHSTAKRAGYDWGDQGERVRAFKQAVNDLETAVASGEQSEQILGDVLFSLVNLARGLDIDPEAALRKASRRFMAKYQGK